MSPSNLANLYEQDFQQWLVETANCLKARNFGTIDTDHLIEELNDLGNSSKAALESNLAILLKLTVQSNAPDTMKNSWYNSIDEHRQRVKNNLQRILL